MTENNGEEKREQKKTKIRTKKPYPPVRLHLEMRPVGGAGG